MKCNTVFWVLKRICTVMKYNQTKDPLSQLDTQ